MNSTTTTRKGRWFATWYPMLMGRIERSGQGALRHDQLAAARMPTWIPTLVPLVVGVARRGEVGDPRRERGDRIERSEPSQSVF
jgi:hypothetical protein